MENLKAIIKELSNICHNQGMNPSDDMILDCSVRIFNSQNIQESCIRKEPDHKLNEKFKDTPATDAQKNLLRQLHIMFNSDITKGQATDLIKKKLPKKE